jgi:hypothetical protein
VLILVDSCPPTPRSRRWRPFLPAARRRTVRECTHTWVGTATFKGECSPLPRRKGTDSHDCAVRFAHLHSGSPQYSPRVIAAGNPGSDEACQLYPAQVPGDRSAPRANSARKRRDPASSAFPLRNEMKNTQCARVLLTGQELPRQLLGMPASPHRSGAMAPVVTLIRFLRALLPRTAQVG